MIQLSDAIFVFQGNNILEKGYSFVAYFSSQASKFTPRYKRGGSGNNFVAFVQ
ncbi:MAG: hypothetical protein ACERKD_09925 [Prolixibacteraceae bacterium]